MFGGCIESDETSSRRWQAINSGWFTFGSIYNNTIFTSINYSGGFDGKNFLIPKITADNQHHYVSHFKILNAGIINIEIVFSYKGEMTLYKQNDTQQLSIGENPDINDISMKIFIDENSTENENYITLSEDAIGENFYLDTVLTPEDEITLYFYVKSYDKTISGEYGGLFNMNVNALASTTTGPIVNVDFDLFDIKGDELVFNLDFYLIFSSDTPIGDLVVSFPRRPNYSKVPVSPISPQQSNYHIDIKLPVDGDDFQYPFDTREGVITLTTKNSSNIKYIYDALNRIKDDTPLKNTTHWHSIISTEGNSIFFSFERNHEQNTFWLLFWLKIIMISLGILIIVSMWKELKFKNKLVVDYLPSLSILPWVSLIFFGLRYIAFYSPIMFAKGPLILGGMCLSLFIMNGYSKRFITLNKRENKND